MVFHREMCFWECAFHAISSAIFITGDSICAGPSQHDIEKEINFLGIKQPHEERPFEFYDEGEVSAFLGIKIKKIPSQILFITGRVHKEGSISSGKK